MIRSWANESPKCTVLVVDDDDCVRQTLTFLLEAEGFRVQNYSNPNEVLGETELPPCSCIVTDYNMPEMDGLDFVAAMRKRGSSIPAILVTGDPNPTVRSRAAAANVAVIEKPDPTNKLPGCIREMMASAIN
jgi:FixJ family two-component response regulator